MDESGLGEKGAACGSRLRSDYLEQQPGDRTQRNEIRIRRGCDCSGPNRTRIDRTLPRSARRSTLIRIGAEKVGRDLLLNFAVEELEGKEQGRLRPKECPREA